MRAKTMKRYYLLCQQKQTKTIRQLKYALYEKKMEELRLYLHQLTVFGAIAGSNEIQDELLWTVEQMNKPAL